MSILSDLMAQFGGSGGQKNMGLLQRLAQGNPEYSSPIGPTRTGAPQGQINPAFGTSSGLDGSKLAELGNQLGAWGAGVSKASAPSRTPVDFGQALAGGQEGLNNQMKFKADLAKANNIDYNDEAQRLLEKQFSGAPLNAQETARLQAINSFRQTIGGTQTDAFGRPMARPSLLDGSGVPSLPQAPEGIAPGTPTGQAPRAGLERFSPEQVAEYKRMRGIR